MAYDKSGPRFGSAVSFLNPWNYASAAIDRDQDLFKGVDTGNNNYPESGGLSTLSGQDPSGLQFGRPKSTGRVGSDIGQPDTPAVLGASTTGGGGSIDQGDLAYLDEQEGMLNRQLGRTDSALAQALDALLQNYNKELSAANKTQGRNLEDFSTKTQQSEMGRSRELGKVDTRARMLADSLRQRLGLAGGSGSSAYQYAAPRAVQRQASSQRGDVLSDYSANFQALDTNKRRGDEDYQELLQELQRQRTQNEGGVRGAIEEQRNSIRDSLSQTAATRQKLMGGGYTGARQAMAPYQSQIQGGESLIDSIYNKYAARYNVNPLQTRTTSLRDYATDKAAVRDNAATGQQNQYAPYKPYTEDDEESIL